MQICAFFGNFCLKVMFLNDTQYTRHYTVADGEWRIFSSLRIRH